MIRKAKSANVIRETPPGTTGHRGMGLEHGPCTRDVQDRYHAYLCDTAPEDTYWSSHPCGRLKHVGQNQVCAPIDGGDAPCSRLVFQSEASTRARGGVDISACRKPSCSQLRTSISSNFSFCLGTSHVHRGSGEKARGPIRHPKNKFTWTCVFP